MKPMYQLLIIVLQFMIDERKDYKISKFKIDDYPSPGICSATYYSSLDSSEETRVINYIRKHTTFSLWLRMITVNAKIDHIDMYYWKSFWFLPRRWYLYRHIFYCWLVYKFKNLFKHETRNITNSK